MSSKDATPPPGHHLASVTKEKGTPLEIISRPTPTPSPTEVLIEVSSIALNMIDYYQRDNHFPPIAYSPAVLGSDVAGRIISSGSSVPSGFSPGTRVLAYAISYFEKGKPDYGAFQKKVLVPYQYVALIPNSLGFNEAAIFPMAFYTAINGFLHQLDLPKDDNGKGKGMLIWGGASSIGIGAIVLAKSIGYTVYATASPQHDEFLKNLGASQVFDYKDPEIVKKILASAKEDGFSFELGYFAIGDLRQCLDVIKEFKGGSTLRVAHAPPLLDDAAKEDGVEVHFIEPPTDTAERLEYGAWAFAWLQEKLLSGNIVSYGKIKLAKGGLEGLNKALDKYRDEGVHGEKFVLEV